MTRVFHDLLHLIESHLLLAVSVSTYFENVEVPNPRQCGVFKHLKPNTRISSHSGPQLHYTKLMHPFNFAIVDFVDATV